MGQTQLLCTRATGLGTPEWRLAQDKLEGKEHTYSYGYFGFDRTNMGYGVKITNIYTFSFHGQASCTDPARSTVKSFAAPLKTGFADQTPHPPEVNRSTKALSYDNGILPEESGHVLTGAVTDEKTIQDIVRNGIALCVENDGEDTTASIKAYTNNSPYCPVLWADYEPVTLNVKKAEVNGTKKLAPGFQYSWGFETEYDDACVVGDVTQAHAWVGYEVGPGTSESIHDLGTQKGEFFTVPPVATPGAREPYQPWVYVVSNGGARSETVYADCTVEPLSVTLSDVHPSDKQYAGLPVTFDWEYKYTLPAGAISGSVYQLKARILCRPKGTDEVRWTDEITGPQMRFVKTGLPAGTIEYKIISWDSTGGEVSTGDSWKSFENKALAVTAADLYPAAGAKAPKNADNRFGWRVVPEEDPDFHGLLTVQSAVFQWRPTGGDGASVRAIAAGTANELTVPAGTFAGYDAIDWRVMLTANTGGVTTSEWIALDTVDARSKAVALSPVGCYVEDTPETPVAFRWLHGIETDTRQTGWTLQYSVDSVGYATLGEGADGADGFTAPYGALPPGTVYWRVRTRNTDNVWGDWSDPATIVVRQAPQTPQVRGTDRKPLPTITWSAKNQEGYRVTIGNFDTGWVAGRETSYTHPDLLPDGTYPVTVRIMTPDGQESAPGIITIEVRNQPFPAPVAHVTERGCDVLLRWQALEGDTVYYLLRDGVPILRTRQAQAWDRYASGRHTYVVRAMRGGYYADSRPVPAISHVENAVVSALEPVDWVPLAAKTGGRPGHDESTGEQVEFRHFYGRALPVAYTSGFVDATNSQSWTLGAAGAADYDRLRALVGKPAVYKDCFGRVRFGVLTGVDGGLAEDVELSLSFTQTDYEERVQYAEDQR